MVSRQNIGLIVLFLFLAAVIIIVLIRVSQSGGNPSNGKILCINNRGCQFNQICSKGTCIPLKQCSIVTSCPVGQVCVSGICQLSS